MKTAAWNPSTIKLFITKSGEYISLIAPTVLILATVGIWFAVVQGEKAINSGREMSILKERATQAPSLQRRPLTAAGYTDAINVLANTNPAIKVSLGRNKDSITVAVTDPALMPEWFYLLSTVQSYRSGLIWSAEKICLKKCDGGNAAFAEIRAYTQEVIINDPAT